MVYRNSIVDNTTENDRRLLAEVMDISLYTRRMIYEEMREEVRPVFECHSICRAIARCIPELKLVDGHYVGLAQVPHEESFKFELSYARHSWLLTPDESIIDPYPVGYLSVYPLLVVCRGDYAPFGGGCYVRDSRVTKEIMKRIIWRRTEILYALIQKALAKKPQG